MYPTTDVAVTYLAARCFNGTHSEEILMSEFNILLRNFRLFYKQPPAGIVLYTWLAPCTKCVQTICKTFEAVTTIIPTCVIYSKGETLPGTCVKYMNTMFQKYGIFVSKEDCCCTDEQKALVLLDGMCADICKYFSQQMQVSPFIFMSSVQWFSQQRFS